MTFYIIYFFVLGCKNAGWMENAWAFVSSKSMKMYTWHSDVQTLFVVKCSVIKQPLKKCYTLLKLDRVGPVDNRSLHELAPTHCLEKNRKKNK